MNVKDRLEDISKRSGLSEDIIRRVIEASRESIIDSLSKCERATLPGICTFNPEVARRIEVGTDKNINTFIRIKAKPSSIITNTVIDNTNKKQTMDEVEEEEKLNILNATTITQIPSYNGIQTRQIQSLL